MQQFIGCDVHKKYSIFSSVNEKGRLGRAVRVSHDREQFRQYLDQLPTGSPIAVESSGHWYWLVDEIERAGHEAHLVNAGEAKRRMGKPNKTDKLDAEGLAILLRNGTLPEVWIPRLRSVTNANCCGCACFWWRFVPTSRIAFTAPWDDTTCRSELPIYSVPKADSNSDKG